MNASSVAASQLVAKNNSTIEKPDKTSPKPNASAVVSDQVLARMTDECEAVVTSYGH